MGGETPIIKRLEEEIGEIKLQIGYILSKFLEEDISEEEREEIEAILASVKKGNYISKEELMKNGVVHKSGNKQGE